MNEGESERDRRRRGRGGGGGGGEGQEGEEGLRKGKRSRGFKEQQVEWSQCAKRETK